MTLQSFNNGHSVVLFGCNEKSNQVVNRSVVLQYARRQPITVRQYHQSRRLFAQKAEEDVKQASNNAKEGEEEAKKEGTEEGVHPLSAEDAAKLKAELLTCQKALEETSKALAEQKEKLARSYADLENMVRIAKKDVANAKEFGIKGFAMKMFDVLDTVELCLHNLPKEIEEDSHLGNAVVALDSTKKQFAKVMSEFEVIPMETKVGDKFDANFHNAVFEMAPTQPDHEHQTVGAILKHGWTRKGNLLRPSHVGVIIKK